MDETSRQLIGDLCEPIGLKPGQVARHEHEYVRNGVEQVFLEVQPLTYCRHVEVSERRSCQDWDRWARFMLMARYSDAERVVLVMDNLNTHGIASLCETFSPREARALARAPGHPLHPQARQLAQHGRDRVERLVRAMPPSASCGHDHHAGGDHYLAA